jgi:DNA-binding response OmpR family regulator
MSQPRILVVEDEEDIRRLVCALIRRAGMDAVEAADGRQGLRTFFDLRPDLVVLDVSLPEVDGLEVLDRIRILSDVPVLVLTARAGELDKVRVLKAGADDYITKPFGRQELIARIEAILRRSAARVGGSDEVLSDSLVELDFAQARVTVAGKAISLTPLEFKLLAALVRHPNKVMGHRRLLDLVWENPSDHQRDRVKLYVGYVRRKLREAADVDPIETVRGFGYRYAPPSKRKRQRPPRESRTGR